MNDLFIKVCGAGILTHDLSAMMLLPQPLDQGYQTLDQLHFKFLA